jgi:hypothetical protein
MANDKRDLVCVLKAELEFVEKGGYRHPARAVWRPQFMFEDSPSCLNFDPAQHPRPCSDCALLRLVPEDSLKRKIPCRYIALNEQGDTLDSLYRSRTQEEIEAAFSQWLKTTIARIEQERTESARAAEHPEVHVRAKFVAGR